MTTNDSQRVVPTEATYAVTRDQLVALVAGPYMYHHKMDEAAIREGDAFNRCRDMTIERIDVLIATRNAMLAAAPAASPAVAPVVGNEALLPCDVAVAPATCFRAGVPLAMVLLSIESRRDGDAPHHFPPKGRFAPVASPQERVSCWRLITPVGPHAWIDGLPPIRNDAEMEAEKRLGWSVELAYSHPPAQTHDDAPHHFPPKGRFAQLAAAQEGVKPIPACWRYVHADPSNSSGWMDYDGDAELWELRGKKAQANGLTIELAYSRPPAQTQPASPEDRRDGGRSGGEHEWGHAAIDAAQADHEGV